MGKRLLLIGGNYFPEPTGIGKYNGEMIIWLSTHGFDCTVVTTYPYYPQWKLQRPYSRRYLYKRENRNVNKDNSLPITVIRCPHYIPINPSGIKRMLSDFSFFLSSYVVVLLLLFRKKRDYVMAVAPPFQVGLLGVLYAKIRGATSIYHIQDLQIDAAKELQMIQSPLVLKMLFGAERFILRHTHFISTISEGMKQKVKEKCNKEIIFFPNWVDLDLFYLIKEKEELKKQFGFEAGDQIVLYSGSIGQKQGLEDIFYCAEKFKNEKRVKFVICGSGPYKERLLQQKEQLKLENVIFYPLQPADKFNAFLNIASVHLVLQKANAGDLMMPSKLSTILATGGIAIVTANKGTSLYELISTYKAGLICKPEDPRSLFVCIKTTLESNMQMIQGNSVEYAQVYLNKEIIMQRFVRIALQGRRGCVSAAEDDEKIPLQQVVREV